MNLTIRTLTVGQMAANCYVISDPVSGEGMIVDPGDDGEYISDMLTRDHINPVMIVATHGHFDHIMAAFFLQQTYGIPFYMSAKDHFLVGRMRESARHFLGIPDIDPPPTPTDMPYDGLRIGGQDLRIHPIPGHTPGSICLELPGTLIVGDTIFRDGGVGRTDHAYASREDLVRSLAFVLSYPSETILLPGHGGQTTVGTESRFHIQ